jgi:hypothetical protein
MTRAQSSSARGPMGLFIRASTRFTVAAVSSFRGVAVASGIVPGWSGALNACPCGRSKELLLNAGEFRIDRNRSHLKAPQRSSLGDGQMHAQATEKRPAAWKTFRSRGELQRHCAHQMPHLALFPGLVLWGRDFCDHYGIYEANSAAHGILKVSARLWFFRATGSASGPLLSLPYDKMYPPVSFRPRVDAACPHGSTGPKRQT